MHAVARLALHPVISNIQVSWVKMGAAGAGACLAAGANDLGGTLMNESISRAAGTQHGQEMPPGVPGRAYPLARPVACAADYALRHAARRADRELVPGAALAPLQRSASRDAMTCGGMTQRTVIGILGGTGKEGSGLGFRWALKGHDVIVGSRSAEKAAAAADRLNRLLAAGAACAARSIAKRRRRLPSWC